MSDLKWGELDHRGEFDELFMENAHVQIERMDETEYWIGITSADGSSVAIRTGVHRGTWYFRVEEDGLNGKSFAVERTRKRPA